MLQPLHDMFEPVSEILRWKDELLPYPTHPDLRSSWHEEIQEAHQSVFEAGEVSFTKEELVKYEAVHTMGFTLFSMFLERAQSKEWSSMNFREKQAHVTKILQTNQVEQRTQAWYDQMKTVLSASEFSTLYGTPRAIAQLAYQKVPVPADPDAPPPPPPRLACQTCDMGPFDWGIRFEPVVKHFLEKSWGVTLVDSGRLVHPNDPHLAASPDALIQDAIDENHPRMGRLVEIKCPITREIRNGIPFEYWCQMQIQMEVTGISECEYAEVKISSWTAKNSAEWKMPEDPIASGHVWLMEKAGVWKYSYHIQEVSNLEAKGWLTRETIPWAIVGMFTQTVARDRVWFESTRPLREAFWKQVEEARNGTLVIPASSRPTKASASASQNECRIQEDV